MKQEVKIYNKDDLYVLLTILGLISLMIGGMLNFLVVKENDCKMPLSANYYFEDEDYFSFNNNSEVELWFLADILEIPFPDNKILHYSIGDVLVVFGFFLFTTFLFKYNSSRKQRALKGGVE